ncbi:MAG: hypothetical protein HOO96_12490 [Polyangiaceae bacterium]|nr:hypothetical protein [Polyangiaceae bacterium]
MKRAPIVLLGLVSVACGPTLSAGSRVTITPSPEAEAPAAATPPCATERTLVLRHPRTDGGTDVVRLTCAGDVATALATTEYPPRKDDLGSDAAPPTPETISTAAFAKVWTAGLGLVRKGLCVAPPTTTGKKVPTLTFENPMTGAARGCSVQGDAWTSTAAEARGLVPLPPVDVTPIWPFQNEYWKDELRYYGTAPSR